MPHMKNEHNIKQTCIYWLDFQLVMEDIYPPSKMDHWFDLLNLSSYSVHFYFPTKPKRSVKYKCNLVNFDDFYLDSQK